MFALNWLYSLEIYMRHQCTRSKYGLLVVRLGEYRLKQPRAKNFEIGRPKVNGANIQFIKHIDNLIALWKCRSKTSKNHNKSSDLMTTE